MNKLFLLLLSIFFLASCSEDDQNSSNTNTSQEVSFGIIKNNQSNNSNGEILIPSKVIVTLKDVTADTLIYNKKILELFDFNGQYLTQNITLNIGSYSVEEYLVTDKDNKVIYASPKEGSELAQYVNDPLPLSFSVELDQVTQVLPEVLTVENTTAEQFGYATFGFNIVNPQTLSFDIVVFDENNEITNAQLFIAGSKLTLKDPDNPAFQYPDETYTFLSKQKIYESTSSISVDNTYNSYRIVIAKDQYAYQKIFLSKEELQSSTDQNLLKISLKNLPFNPVAIEDLILRTYIKNTIERDISESIYEHDLNEDLYYENLLKTVHLITSDKEEAIVELNNIDVMGEYILGEVFSYGWALFPKTDVFSPINNDYTYSFNFDFNNTGIKSLKGLEYLHGYNVDGLFKHNTIKANFSNNNLTNEAFSEEGIGGSYYKLDLSHNKLTHGPKVNIYSPSSRPSTEYNLSHNQIDDEGLQKTLANTEGDNFYFDLTYNNITKALAISDNINLSHNKINDVSQFVEPVETTQTIGKSYNLSHNEIEDISLLSLNIPFSLSHNKIKRLHTMPSFHYNSSATGDLSHNLIDTIDISPERMKYANFYHLDLSHNKLSNLSAFYHLENTKPTLVNVDQGTIDLTGNPLTQQQIDDLNTHLENTNSGYRVIFEN